MRKSKRGLLAWLLLMAELQAAYLQTGLVGKEETRPATRGASPCWCWWRRCWRAPC